MIPNKEKLEWLESLAMQAKSEGRQLWYCSNKNSIIKRIISKHWSYFYCLNCFHSFRIAKTKLNCM